MQRFAKPHVIGQYPAEPVMRQRLHPLIAVFLIITEYGGELLWNCKFQMVRISHMIQQTPQRLAQLHVIARPCIIHEMQSPNSRQLHFRSMQISPADPYLVHELNHLLKLAALQRQQCAVRHSVVFSLLLQRAEYIFDFRFRDALHLEFKLEPVRSLIHIDADLRRRMLCIQPGLDR
ncbi:hypothetical protein D3C77_430340 [compost metagenome]